MGEKCSYGIVTVFYTIFALAGYFVYDGINGMLGMLLIAILMNCILILSFIPIVGNIAQYFLMKYVMTKMLIMTGLVATTLTGVIFWFNMLLGFFFSILVIILILITIVKR